MPRIGWRSTRAGDSAPAIPLCDAVVAGLAPDGGLFVPERLPRFIAREFADAAAEPTVVRVTRGVLEPFTRGDRLEPRLAEVCRAALDFPIRLRRARRGKLRVLELFHGPTAAFKDFGARFLAESLVALRTDSRERTVLVATSGDTGGAVAGAFFGKPGFRVAILYPSGRISPRQEKQLCAWGGNVRAFAVQGDFDACQALAKAAFADPVSRERFGWLSANSINAGRLLPQAAYYAWASARHQAETGREAAFVVPTGNLGNALACIWARAMGFPIRQVVLAANANRAIPEFFATGRYAPRATVATFANAMDVGAPSNFERLQSLVPGLDELRTFATSTSVSDDAIRDAIRDGVTRYGEIWCPHTATAVVAAERLEVEDAIVVATAHPAKFDSIVEPLIGAKVEIPSGLAALLDRPTKAIPLAPELKSLLAALD